MLRPKDLNEHSLLYCGECVAHYSAEPEDYRWMPSDEALTCVCGTELVPLEREDEAA